MGRKPFERKWEAKYSDFRSLPDLKGINYVNYDNENGSGISSMYDGYRWPTREEEGVLGRECLNGNAAAREILAIIGMKIIIFRIQKIIKSQYKGYLDLYGRLLENIFYTNRAILDFSNMRDVVALYDPDKGFRLSTLLYNWFPDESIKKLIADEIEAIRIEGLSIDTPVGDDSDGLTLLDMFADNKTENPLERLEKKEIIAYIIGRYKEYKGKDISKAEDLFLAVLSILMGQHSGKANEIKKALKDEGFARWDIGREGIRQRIERGKLILARILKEKGIVMPRWKDDSDFALPSVAGGEQKFLSGGAFSSSPVYDTKEELGQDVIFLRNILKPSLSIELKVPDYYKYDLRPRESLIRKQLFYDLGFENITSKGDFIFIRGNGLLACLDYQVENIEIVSIETRYGRIGREYIGIGSTIFDFLHREALRMNWTVTFVYILELRKGRDYLRRLIRKYFIDLKVVPEGNRGLSPGFEDWDGREKCTVVGLPLPISRLSDQEKASSPVVKIKLAGQEKLMPGESCELNDRQLIALKLLCQNESYKGIGSILHLSHQGTVKKIVHSILDAFGLEHNIKKVRAQLIEKARQIYPDIEVNPLTDTEKDILALMQKGKARSRDIAVSRRVHTDANKRHISGIKRKLGIQEKGFGPGVAAKILRAAEQKLHSLPQKNPVFLSHLQIQALLLRAQGLAFEEINSRLEISRSDIICGPAYIKRRAGKMGIKIVLEKGNQTKPYATSLKLIKSLQSKGQLDKDLELSGLQQKVKQEKFGFSKIEALKLLACGKGLPEIIIEQGRASYSSLWDLIKKSSIALGVDMKVSEKADFLPLLRKARQEGLISGCLSIDELVLEIEKRIEGLLDKDDILKTRSEVLDEIKAEALSGEKDEITLAAINRYYQTVEPEAAETRIYEKAISSPVYGDEIQNKLSAITPRNFQDINSYRSAFLDFLVYFASEDIGGLSSLGADVLTDIAAKAFKFEPGHNKDVEQFKLLISNVPGQEERVLFTLHSVAAYLYNEGQIKQDINYLSAARDILKEIISFLGNNGEAIPTLYLDRLYSLIPSATLLKAIKGQQFYFRNIWMACEAHYDISIVLRDNNAPGALLAAEQAAEAYIKAKKSLLKAEPLLGEDIIADISKKVANCYIKIIFMSIEQGSKIAKYRIAVERLLASIPKEDFEFHLLNTYFNVALVHEGHTMAYDLYANEDIATLRREVLFYSKASKKELEGMVDDIRNRTILPLMAFRRVLDKSGIFLNISAGYGEIFRIAGIDIKGAKGRIEKQHVRLVVDYVNICLLAARFDLAEDALKFLFKTASGYFDMGQQQKISQIICAVLVSDRRQIADLFRSLLGLEERRRKEFLAFLGSNFQAQEGIIHLIRDIYLQAKEEDLLREFFTLGAEMPIGDWKSILDSKKQELEQYLSALKGDSGAKQKNKNRKKEKSTKMPDIELLVLSRDLDCLEYLVEKLLSSHFPPALLDRLSSYVEKTIQADSLSNLKFLIAIREGFLSYEEKNLSKYTGLFDEKLIGRELERIKNNGIRINSAFLFKIKKNEAIFEIGAEFSFADINSKTLEEVLWISAKVFKTE
ncbi:MAG: hypothetical protein PHF69_07020, partial [Candidatus Omnitrophica bacterium]|nr:hypothetical protein [Candidatus Omnitrophota bacterium]